MTTATVASPVAVPTVPFRGIEPFRFVDQKIFFARTEESQKLLRLVTLYRGVLLYGDSGSGKSSVINAGLIPVALEEGFAPERLRVQPRRGEEIVLERISTTGEGKAPYLPSFFADNDDATRVVFSTESFMDRIADANSQNQVPLLIFDQFEEFVTLFEEAPRREGAHEGAVEAQESILRMLVDLIRDARLRVKLLLVFREDYLAKFSKLFFLCPDLPDHYFRITAPDVSALHDIIRGPFEKFPGHFGQELSKPLTVRLTQAIKERSEANKINLSEIQIASLKLWQSDDPDKLFNQKGLKGLLADYLSNSLKQLPNDLQDAAVALLSRLVTPSGTRNIVSEYDLISKLKEDEAFPEDKLKAALQALVQDTKLVRRERRYETYFYDIVSEFLVPWIMDQKAERLAEASRRELEVAEGVKRRRAYRLTVASLVIAAAIGLAALWSYRNKTVSALARDEVKHAISLQTKAESEREQFKSLAERSTNEAARDKQALINVQATTEKKIAETIAQKDQDIASKNKEIENLKQRFDQETTKIKLDLQKVTAERDKHSSGKDLAERKELLCNAKLITLERRCPQRTP